MPNSSSARRDKKEKNKKMKDPKPLSLSKQGRSASSDSSSSSSSQAAEEARSVKTTASSRSLPLTATGKAGRNPSSSREMDSSASLICPLQQNQKGVGSLRKGARVIQHLKMTIRTRVR
jgi:hypothetical protein